MFCDNCGNQLMDDAAFCDVCGTPTALNDGTKDKVVINNVQKNEDLEKKNEQLARKNHLLLGGLFAVIAVAVLIIPILLLKPFGNKNTDGDSEAAADSGVDDYTGDDYYGDAQMEEFSGPRELLLLDGAPVVPASTYKILPVIAANSSSTIVQQGTTNDPILLFDGRDDTNWQEGVSGYGIGESISFSFDSYYDVKFFGFKLGNWKTDDYYYGNAKPKTITFIIGDYVGQVTFDGDREVEWVELTESVNADSVTLFIDDVYRGTKWEDTCITEITVYGQ